MPIPAFAITELDGSMWVAMGCWFGLWAVLIVTGLILTQREKQRGGPPVTHRSEH